jgi:hypothetical protein
VVYFFLSNEVICTCDLNHLRQLKGKIDLHILIIYTLYVDIFVLIMKFILRQTRYVVIVCVCFVKKESEISQFSYMMIVYVLDFKKH